MADGKNTRLFKIASEINIGKDAIVDFLVSKGYQIENKSTAMLTPEMTEAVYDKFKKELKAFEKQQEKFQKHKKFPKKQTDPLPLEKLPEPKKTVDEQVMQISETASIPVEEIPTASTITDTIQPELAKEQKLDTGPKVGDIIQLPGLATKASKQAPTTPKKAEKDTAPVAKLVDKEELKEESDSSVDTKPIVDTKPDTDKKSTVDTKPDFDEKPTVDTKKTEQVDIASIKEQKTEGQAPTLETKEEIPPASQEVIEIKPVDETLPRKESAEQAVSVNLQTDDKTEVTSEKTERNRNRRRKKQKRLIEIDIDDPNAPPKLKGLKILGKIDLDAPTEAKPADNKPIKKRKPKTTAEEETDESGDKKSKKKIKPRDKAPIKEKVVDKKKRKRRKSIRDTISEEDVEAAIKKTISGMESTSGLSARHKLRQKKKEQREEKETRRQEEDELQATKIVLTEFVTTANIADLMKVPVNEVILKCMQLGLMVSINQRLDKDTIQVICDDYGFEVEFHDEKSVALIEEEEEQDENLQPRPPIVTIMGHVDHGKTSLLDYIRHSNVVAGEAGGITQHIGAYRVTTGDNETIASNESGSGIRSITFLDTPGHEAFTAMRARGAQATDIVILVVAADDSVMPQTVEAISHAEAAKVPIVVAINKIDKPDANPDRIKQQLADHNILVEDWGGKYQAVEISAKKGINVEKLLEKILLEAEMLELKANPDRKARGVIVEANMDKGLGPIATVIVQKGTLKIGDAFLAGINSGKVRAMFDERGKNLKEAGPTVPARVVGFDGLPEAGDIFVALDSETEARNIATERQQLKREQDFRQVRLVTLDDISQKIKEGGIKDLNLIIKADVSGSMEALSDSLLKLSTDEVRVNILHRGVGTINESDVMLALASQAVIVGFQVNASPQARRIAEKDAVDIRQYNIIYDCINEIHLALEGLLTPELKEDITSEVEVRKIFRISRLGTIAGCYVLSGKISRNDKIRVLRNGLPIFSGGIQSLKRGKDDVKEVDTSYECGIQLDGFNELEESDIIQGYKITEVKRQLK